MIWALLALLAGAMLPIQAGVNAELARIVGHPVRSALVSFAVGTGALLFLAFALTSPSWPWSRMLQAPWWVYVGGLLGAVYVVGVIALAPRLGALLAFVLVIAGQLLASLLLDHFGLLYPRHPVNLPRLLGAVLLLLGVLLIRRY
jgi:transporter family-2 protein